MSKTNFLLLLVLCVVLATNAMSELETRIIGGVDADENTAPYIASLRELTMANPYGKHYCCGSILNEKWVLTAGHCTMSIDEQFLKVVVGTIRLSTGGDTYGVDSIIKNKNFDEIRMKNDIALLRISGSIKFYTYVQPIPLPTDNVGDGVKCTLVGWGYKEFKGTTPDKLQVLNNFTTISTEECNDRFSATSGENLPITDNQLCTITEEGEGTCQGDSGSPLVCGGVQVGIVSWGIPCGVGKPDVFTRVLSYINWINRFI